MRVEFKDAFPSVLPQKSGYFRADEQVASTGIHAKQLQAGWKEDYLLKVLAAGS